MKLDMNDLQGGIEDYHYSDIWISGFGFFWIFSILKSLLPASEASHVYFRKAKCWCQLPVSEANHVFPSEPPLPTPEGRAVREADASLDINE